MLLKKKKVWRKEIIEIIEPEHGSHLPVVHVSDWDRSRSECERLIHVELCFDADPR